MKTPDAELTDKEIEARREAALKKLLATPPKPHKPKPEKPREAKKQRTKRKPG